MFIPRSIARLVAFCLLLSLGFASEGCRPNRPEAFARYIPSSKTARTALETMLNEWTQGKEVGDVAVPGLKVRLVDSHRKPGQRLLRYSILGEIPAERVRSFGTRLTFADPEESAIVRFSIVGDDPLWIFRQEDFEMISHWMHSMDEAQEITP